MNTNLIIYIIMLIVGIIINVFMGKFVKIIFKKDGTLPRVPLRILGIYLIINSISYIFHI
ncbi:hypothetical protein CSC2_36120 [Clostridium zeae]|uniref:Uncharacterized protein n=1 Tax=Clostridium zeae TaxID=2759022 RepID=A0ABQ1EE93_9CLOT|nr:hypothetical protein [Clostridium zeae]GFZ33086.1 hypothetical protein CSC2_36120 [Clostridium zeae]